MIKVTHWTEAELKVLTNNFKHHTVKYIAKRLNRSENAVTRKLKVIQQPHQSAYRNSNTSSNTSGSAPKEMTDLGRTCSACRYGSFQKRSQQEDCATSAYGYCLKRNKNCSKDGWCHLWQEEKTKKHFVNVVFKESLYNKRKTPN